MLSFKTYLFLGLMTTILVPNSESRLNQLLFSQKHGQLGAPYGLPNAVLPAEEWFDQKLDHLTVFHETTWKQRYFMNATWYVPGGPVFLMIGGEGEASPKWMVQGTWLDYARNHKALCFQVEHRFYGKSQPLPNLDVNSLQYLSSEQALEDLAYFITSMNQKYNLPSNVKWIAFGGSYPGSLAAWLRYKYPHLVHGAMSASGPLRAVVDFPEYFQVVTDALATISDKCVKSVYSATQTISKMLKSEDDARYLSEIFKLCTPLNISNTKDVSSFVESLADNFAGVVQYNKDNRDGSKNITIDTLCEIMEDENLKPVSRYAAVNYLMLKKSNETCLDYKYDKMIAEMKNTSWDSEVAGGARQWMFQTCTEFGFYQTSSQANHVFGQEFSIDFFVDQCKDIYQSEFSKGFIEKAVRRTNINYGSLNLEVSRVVFVHGSIDPWHALGIYETRSLSAPAIYINGTAHCANMYPPSDDDLPQLKKARQRINHLIGKWLKHDYHTKVDLNEEDTVQNGDKIAISETTNLGQTTKKDVNFWETKDFMFSGDERYRNDDKDIYGFTETKDSKFNSDPRTMVLIINDEENMNLDSNLIRDENVELFKLMDDIITDETSSPGRTSVEKMNIMEDNGNYVNIGVHDPNESGQEKVVEEFIFDDNSKLSFAVRHRRLRNDGNSRQKISNRHNDKLLEPKISSVDNWMDWILFRGDDNINKNNDFDTVPAALLSPCE